MAPPLSKAEAQRAARIMLGQEEDDLSPTNRQQFMSYMDAGPAPQIAGAQMSSDPNLERDINDIWTQHGRPGPGGAEPTLQPEPQQPMAIPVRAPAPQAVPQQPVEEPPPVVVGTPRSANIIADNADAKRAEASKTLGDNPYTRGAGQALGVVPPDKPVAPAPQPTPQQPAEEPPTVIPTGQYVPGQASRPARWYPQSQDGIVDVPGYENVEENVHPREMYDDVGEDRLAGLGASDTDADGNVEVRIESLQRELGPELAAEVIGGAKPDNRGRVKLNRSALKARVADDAVGRFFTDGEVEGAEGSYVAVPNGTDVPDIVRRRTQPLDPDAAYRRHTDEAIGLAKKLTAQQDALDKVQTEAREKLTDVNRETADMARQRAAKRAEELDVAFAEVKQRMAEANAAKDVDPGRWAKNASTLTKIAAVIGAALMGFAGKGDVALKTIQNQIDADINAQQAEHNNKRNRAADSMSLYSLTKAKFDNDDDAVAAARKIAYDQVAQELDTVIHAAGADARTTERALKLKEGIRDQIARDVEFNALVKGRRRDVYDPGARGSAGGFRAMKPDEAMKLATTLYPDDKNPEHVAKRAALYSAAVRGQPHVAGGSGGADPDEFEPVPGVKMSKEKFNKLQANEQAPATLVRFLEQAAQILDTPPAQRTKAMRMRYNQLKNDIIELRSVAQGQGATTEDAVKRGSVILPNLSWKVNFTDEEKAAAEALRTEAQDRAGQFAAQHGKGRGRR
jgi:hypothetical protein